MDVNDFRNQLIDKLRNTYLNKDENKDVVHLTLEQAEEKFDVVVGLINRTHEKYNLEENLGKRKQLDEKIAIIFKEFPDILTIQDKYGYNLGIIAVQYKLEQSVLVALDNIEASLQQDNWGCNIGIHAANKGLEQAVLKALDNNEASLQQNELGKNIGMSAADNDLKQAALKAMQNKEACKQKDGYGNTIESIYKRRFGKALTY